MHKEHLKIIFFGSGQFALPILKVIHKQYTLSGLVATKPKPRGRGLKVRLSVAAQWAHDMDIEIYSPQDPNDKEFMRFRKSMECKLVT